MEGGTMMDRCEECGAKHDVWDLELGLCIDCVEDEANGVAVIKVREP